MDKFGTTLTRLPYSLEDSQDLVVMVHVSLWQLSSEEVYTVLSQFNIL